MRVYDFTHDRYLTWRERAFWWQVKWMLLRPIFRAAGTLGVWRIKEGGFLVDGWFVFDPFNRRLVRQVREAGVPATAFIDVSVAEHYARRGVVLLHGADHEAMTRAAHARYRAAVKA